MGARGRKSKAELELVAKMPGSRPAPPENLSPEEAGMWDAIVNQQAPGHFDATTLPLLESYVSHQTQARRIAAWITKVMEDEDASLNDYDKLLKMQEKVSRTMASLSVRLGFAKTTAGNAKQAPASKKPWE